MLIDWFTVAAQALNFLILVWLMRRFLWKPIRRAIDEREQRIAKELADAETKQAEALRQRDDLRAKNDALEERRAELLAQATAEASAERQRLLAEAKQAADAMTARRQAALQREAVDFGLALSRRTQKEVFAVARKVLADLSSTSLEERMADLFSQQLRALVEPGLANLKAALVKESGHAQVRSAFALPAGPRERIQTTIEETLRIPVFLRFEAAPDLIGGIELTAGGQRLGWNIADYVASLETGVAQLLKEREQATAKAEPKPGPTPRGAEAPRPAPESP